MAREGSCNRGERRGNRPITGLGGIITGENEWEIGQYLERVAYNNYFTMISNTTTQAMFTTGIWTEVKSPGSHKRNTGEVERKAPLETCLSKCFQESFLLSNNRYVPVFFKSTTEQRYRLNITY